MQTDPTNIRELWELFVSDRASAQQVADLFAYIKHAGNDDEHIACFRQALDGIPPVFHQTEEAVVHSILDAIIASDEALRTSLHKTVRPPVPVRRVPFIRKWVWAAASVLLLLGIMGGALYFRTAKNSKPAVAVNAASVQPGRDGAILTLANGSQVLLDTIKNGIVALQGGATARVANGRLVYEDSGNEVVYNTMTTHKGRQFQLMLPDGTQVWLNSASSIRYPTVFTGNERKVAMTGEAYFEVAKNAKMPFKVNVNNKAEIAVFGTHFNVNAYENEKSMNTTLLEGCVRVSNPLGNVVLQPGQQAQMDPQAQRGIKVVHNADTEKIIAWKNGLFNFDGASLEEVMRQVERWYDIEVVYEKGVPNISFLGEITKDVTLTDLLTGLQKSEVHFRVEGRKLIVLP